MSTVRFTFFDVLKISFFSSIFDLPRYNQKANISKRERNREKFVDRRKKNLKRERRKRSINE